MLKDSAKFGGFACVFSCAYKFILCLFRRIGCHNDRINAPIAGFFSALSLRIEAKSRKQIMLILVLSRGVDSMINLVEDSGMKVIPQNIKYIGIFMLCSTFLSSLMGMQQSVLSKGMRNIYKTWSQMTKNDQLLCEVYERMLKDSVPTF